MSRKYLFVILAMLFYVGCEELTTNEEPKGDPAGAQAKVQLANQSLEATFMTWANGSFNSASDFDRLNFSTANTLYKEALVMDPNNTQASFGAALTEIFTAYADPQINAMIKKIESAADSGFLGKSFYNVGLFHSTAQMKIPIEQLAETNFYIFQKALTDPPLISEMQTVMKNSFMPRIAYAVEQLNKVASTDTFKFEVTGRMQGDQQRRSIYLYPAEAHFFAAAVNGVKMYLESMMIYKFEMADYSQQSLVTALNQDNANFFGLASDGTARAASAKTAMTEMIDKLLSGIQKLETISGNKTDAAIKIGNDGIKQRDLDTVKTYLNKMKTSLTQPVSIFVEDGDRDGNDYTIQVQLGKFFDNPVTNFKKSFLPPYTVEPSGEKGIHLKFNAETYDQFSFPDPTFGGVFPGMTNSVLKKLLYIDEAFAYKLEGNINFYGINIPTNLPRLKIVTPSRTYEVAAKRYNYGWNDNFEYEFFIMDQNNQAFTMFIDYGEGYKELTCVEPFKIEASRHIYKEIQLMKPGELYGWAQYSPTRVSLNWTSWLYSCVIQRSIGTGNFSDYQSLQYTSFFEDYGVSSGVTYNYRVRTTIPNEPWMIVFKELQYTNSVSVTP
ncbi:MAG TPA: hypothetical protein PK559_05975 [Ignavibacteriaceae bacterium]|nr:hypothetical protein [Ignavibacteriaceae bacterium]